MLIAIEALKKSFEWKNINDRVLSTVIYSLLRHFGVKYKTCLENLKELDLFSSSKVHVYSIKLQNTEFDFLYSDGRSSNHTDGFYENFPELKHDALVFEISKCQEKSSSFSALDLSKFLNEKYTELTGDIIEPGQFIRSE